MAIQHKHHRFSIIASILLLAAAIWTTSHSLALQPTDAQCIQNMNSWSPAMSAIEHKWETFLEVAFLIKSIYLGQPTPEVEAAWTSLLPDHPIAIPDARLHDLNQTKDGQWVRLSPSDDSVLAVPEVFLQLSCLNLLRQHTYRHEYNYSHLRSFQGPEAAVMRRMGQCLERLRQAFMCWADLTPLLKEVVPNLPPVYDMETLHYCRNFDAILKWTDENAIRNITFVEGCWGANQ